MSQISILGCGWLGLPLAMALQKNGYSVKGSTTSDGKVPVLKQHGIEPFLIRLPLKVEDAPAPAFFDADVLVITAPFRRSLSDPFDYYRQMDSILPYVAASPVQLIVFTSSTAVYDNSDFPIDEKGSISSSPRAQALFATERLLWENTGRKVTIVRLSGLYGPERPPGRFLAGKQGLQNGNSPVNLIHLDDAIGIVMAIIKGNMGNEVFNASSDFHGSRKAFYTEAARRMGLPEPHFVSESGPGPYKKISNEKVKKMLGYYFLYDNPFEAP